MPTATRTPTFAAPAGSASRRPAVLHQRVVPPQPVPPLVRVTEHQSVPLGPQTLSIGVDGSVGAPVWFSVPLSSTRNARADFGLVSGTPSGRASWRDASWKNETRAWPLIEG